MIVDDIAMLVYHIAIIIFRDGDSVVLIVYVRHGLGLMMQNRHKRPEQLELHSNLELEWKNKRVYT